MAERPRPKPLPSSPLRLRRWREPDLSKYRALFARVGAVNWDADVSVSGFDAGGGADGTDFTYGAGAQFRVGSLGIRAEYEVFDISDADNVDLLSLGVTWTFF